MAIVTNLGGALVFAVPGNSSTVASPANGIAVLPGKSFPIAIGAWTNIAVVTLSGVSGLNISFGS